MRKSATSFALAGLLLLGASGSAVLAQTSAPASPDAAAPPMAGHHRMQPHDPAKQLEHMTAKLSLTPDQQTQIKPILESHVQQIQALRADTTVARPDKMDKMKTINADFNSKIEAVLNDQQKQQWAQMQQEGREKMREHMHEHKGAADAPPTPPSQ